MAPGPSIRSLRLKTLRVTFGATLRTFSDRAQHRAGGAAVTILGYARVSTSHQSVGMQIQALKDAGAERIWSEQASGRRDDRPPVGRVVVLGGRRDVLMVWRLDRLGRSLPHLLNVVADLDARGIEFRSLTEALDTTTPGGRLAFHVFGAVAQFERALAAERSAAGWRPPGRRAGVRVGPSCRGHRRRGAPARPGRSSAGEYRSVAGYIAVQRLPNPGLKQSAAVGGGLCGVVEGCGWAAGAVPPRHRPAARRCGGRPRRRGAETRWHSSASCSNSRSGPAESLIPPPRPPRRIPGWRRPPATAGR